MENFQLLGSVTQQLQHEFIRLYYLILPVFFALAIALDWFRNPAGSPDFIDTLKRAFIATLLVASFTEISDTILALTSAISDKISDLSGLDSLLRMAGEKCRHYPLSPTSLILGFDDLVVALLSFASYVVLYLARYISVALYHFMWIFLSILAPLLISFHLFRGIQSIAVNLFKSLVEVACWKIVWSVLSAMITALSFGNAYAADGNYLTIILLNFVIALAMLGTPLIVKSLVGGGISAMSESLGMGAALALAKAPTKAMAALDVGREVLSNTAGWSGPRSEKMLPHLPGLRSVDSGKAPPSTGQPPGSSSATPDFSPSSASQSPPPSTPPPSIQASSPSPSPPDKR